MRPILPFAWIPLIATLPAQNVDIALGGTATQSGTLFGGTADRAIDGNRDGDFTHGSVTHTDGLGNDWWQVALAQPGRVDEVVIYNRADCCADRMSDFRVRVLAGANTTFSGDYYTAIGTWLPLGRSLRIAMPPGGVQGDTVRIEKLGTQGTTWHLTIAEVEVIRYGTQNEVDLAPLGVASQSSNYAPNMGFASAAIDRVTDGMYFQGSVSHTLDQPGSWWRVDLPWATPIDVVRLWNRTDLAGNRLSNFRVSVLLGNTEVFGQDCFTTTGSVGTLPFAIAIPPNTVGTAVRVSCIGPGRSGEQIVSLAEVEVVRYGFAANWTAFGTGCAGSLGIPSLGAIGTPVLGSPFRVRAQAVPATPGAALLILGLSDRHWGGTPLPLDLGVFGAPGCPGLVSPDATSLVLASGGTATSTLTIPGDRALLGTTLFQQAFVLDQAAGNALGAVVSNGGRLIVGG